MQSSRLFEIIYILMDKHFATCEDLARELEVSTRTIRRDVDALSAAGVPVYMSRGKNGGVHLMPHYVLDKSVVSDNEQTEILAALSALRATGIDTGVGIGGGGSTGSTGGASGANSAKSASTTKHNASNKNTGSKSDALKRLSRVFQRDAIDWLDIDLSFWGAPPEFKRAFELIKKSIITKHQLQFGYYDVNGELTMRTVEPVKLAFKESSWYVRAYCLMRNDWRTFKLFRMDVERMQILPETFEPRIDTGSLDYTGDSKGAQRVKLLFEASAVHRVHEEFAPDWITALDDGRFLVELDIAPDARTHSYLLSFGAELEVLEPASVRARLTAQARDILNIYSDGCG
jgi:predicted DNA-binding transcriptional regulator YafY